MAEEQEDILLFKGDTVEIFNYTIDFKGFIAQIHNRTAIVLEGGKYATFLFPKDYHFQTTRLVLVEKENTELNKDYTIRFSG
jgi:putative SOS response-associated peptidase YedK